MSAVTSPGQTVTVPVGANAASIQILAADGSDITGSCAISAVSSDPSVIQIGSPDATNPSTIPFVAKTAGGNATITYTASNTEGQIVQTDTLNIEVAAPASMIIKYMSTLVASKAKPAAKPTK